MKPITEFFRWDYNNAFFFSGTLASTIGYGNIAPKTNEGKLFCLGFILLGIPYFAFFMSAISDLINHLMDRLRRQIERVKKRRLPYYAVPSVYSSFGLVFVIAVPAMIFQKMEGTLII